MLYCRRAQNRPQTRARACRACNLAKVKCTLQPQCLRCSNKGLNCVYDATTAPVVTVKDGLVASLDLSQYDVQRCSPSVSTSGDGTTETLDDWCGFEVTPDANEEQTTMDWGAFELITNQSFPNTPKDTSPQLPEPGLGTMSHDGTLVDSSPWDFHNGGGVATCDPQHLLACKSAWSQQTVLRDGEQIPALVRPTHISEQPDSSFLSQISMSDPIAHCTANVVMRMLRAFPQMMLRRETFPPFVHAHWHRHSHDNSTESALPTPLVSCMGIAQVFASQNLETRPFLWRSIQMEQRSAAEKVDPVLYYFPCSGLLTNVEV